MMGKRCIQSHMYTLNYIYPSHVNNNLRVALQQKKKNHQDSSHTRYLPLRSASTLEDDTKLWNRPSN